MRSRDEKKDFRQGSFRIEPSLFRQFQQSLNGESMNSALIEMIEERIKGGVSKVREDELPQPKQRISTEIADRLVQSVVTELQRNTRWAETAIFKSQLGLAGTAAFSDRIDHFLEEKQKIASVFCQWLTNRIVGLIEKGKRCILVIDSGTTCFWTFDHLGHFLASKAEELGRNGLTIVTNNLAGVEAFLSYVRRNTVGSKLLTDWVDCKLLPGTALAQYVAVTGDDTQAALRALKQPESDKQVIIGLVTGNWVRLSDGYPRYAIPLARGRGHRQFKEALLDISDEVYLLSPLGKIFVNRTLEQINASLGYTSSTDDEKRPYENVEIPHDKEARIRLVTTYRSGDQILFAHSQALRTVMRAREEDYSQYAVKNFDSVPDMFMLFNLDEPDLRKQAEIEFPHKVTQKQVFMRDNFSVIYPGLQTIRVEARSKQSTIESQRFFQRTMAIE